MITLDKSKYKTLDDAMKLHKQQKAYILKSSAEKYNSEHTDNIRPKYTDDELKKNT